MNIALVGRMGAGKTTVADMLVGRGWTRHSWAEPVRAIFAMAYDGDLSGPGYADTKARLYPTSYGPRSGRELLQRIGTDALRDAVDADFWLKAGVKRSGTGLTVNDDTRFLNEAAALRDLGFTIIRVTRPSLGDNGDLHPSETEQARIVADYELWNSGSIDDLRYALGSILSRGGVSPVAPAPISHEVVSEEWGSGDGAIFDTRHLLGDMFAQGVVEYRGEWPPDTRVAGRLTCCGETSHTLSCPQYR